MISKTSPSRNTRSGASQFLRFQDQNPGRGWPLSWRQGRKRLEEVFKVLYCCYKVMILPTFLPMAHPKSKKLGEGISGERINGSMHLSPLGRLEQHTASRCAVIPGTHQEGYRRVSRYQKPHTHRQKTKTFSSSSIVHLETVSLLLEV